MTSLNDSIISLVTVFVITILILYLSFIFTKSLGKGLHMKPTGGYMELLDRIPLGQDKAVAIIRAGGKYYLIGIAASEITLLAELPKEELGNITKLSGERGAASFRELLRQTAGRNKKRGGKEEQDEYRCVD